MTLIMKTHSDPCQTSKIEIFAVTVGGFTQFNHFYKRSLTRSLARF